MSPKIEKHLMEMGVIPASPLEELEQMLCYKDRTFCKSDCKNSECFRYYDEGVAKDASDFGLPVAVSDYSKSCQYYLPPSNS
jgi:hypothetical protein